MNEFENKFVLSCGEVYLTLGGGYKECVYQRALSLELFNNNYKHSTEVNVNITYKGAFIGFERADIVVSNPYVVIELKAQNQKISQKEIFQTHRYLVDLGISTGYLVNFSTVNYKVTSENITNSIEIYKVESNNTDFCSAYRFDGNNFSKIN